MNENSILKSGIKNIVWTITTQAVSFVLSLIMGLVLPKYMGVVGFGYWQIYLLYTSFIMVFSFGFNDGIYLRYGRKDYTDLPFARLRSAIRIYLIKIIAITVILFLIVYFFEPDYKKKVVLFYSAFNLLPLGINGTLVMVLQSSNRIKLNSVFTILYKVIFALFVGILIYSRHSIHVNVIISDVVVKVILLAINMSYCRELFAGKGTSFLQGMKEYFLNIRVGYKLMIAMLFGMLLFGFGRFMAERFLPINVFSLYSFSSTLVFFLMAFFSAASLAMYPMLKRINVELLPKYYTMINILLSVLLLFLLLSYFPIKWIVNTYINEYNNIFDYFHWLIIVIIPQGKIQFLINTYYKVLRKEKQLMQLNLLIIALMFVVITPIFIIYKNIWVLVFGTLFALFTRYYVSDRYLKKILNIESYKQILIELLLLIIFVISIAFDKLLYGIFMYAVAVMFYIISENKILIRTGYMVYKLFAKRQHTKLV